MNTISDKELSIVVQGAIDPTYTIQCLNSIRKFFPGAEIILSTWNGSDVSRCNYDKLVLSNDPGGADCSRDGKGINNCNREIVSTIEGLKLVTRKYAIKIRNDIVFENNRILSLDFRGKNREPAFSFFKERVVVCSIYSRLFAVGEQSHIFPLLFHPSDWIYFGLTQDLIDLFDIERTNEPEFSLWFKDKDQERGRFIDSHKFRLWKFSPEAYIWVTYLKKKTIINCVDKLDITRENLRLSRRSIINNFFIGDQNHLGILMEKYKIKQHLMPVIDREGLYTNYKWQKDFKRFCDKKYRIKLTKDLILSTFVSLFKVKRNKR